MTRRRGLSVLLLGVAALAGPVAPAADEGPPESSCVACHSQLEDEQLAPVTLWPGDVHAEAKLGCVGCHGGDPSVELADDVDAMAPEKGFREKPGRLQIAEFCARCHSDADLMRAYNPQLRVDQLAEYRTSVHGKRNAAGDPVPATCTDCHGAHGILPVSSPDSPVYATHVPATCGRCHADAAKMAPYGLPTDQLEAYTASVHGTAILELGDTAAPACNDCHGNHGAAPPGVRSVARVCGQCHGREGRLFRDSIKQELFDSLDVSECTVCHDNHRIRHPTPELFHSGSAPVVSAGRVTGSEPFTAELGDIEAGGEATASWSVVLHIHLAETDERYASRVEVTAEGMAPLELDATVRPGDRPSPDRGRDAEAGDLRASLSVDSPSGLPVQAGDSLRMGLRVWSGTGQPLRGVQVRTQPGGGVDPVPGSVCLTCHSPGDTCDQATGQMYESIISLDRSVREAADLLRRAELAGMEVGDARFRLNSEARTAQIESRALIHSFEPDRLVVRSEEGRAVAQDALDAGTAALAEIDYRRTGLAVALVAILMVALGLYLKIRQLERDRRPEPLSEPPSAGSPAP